MCINKSKKMLSLKGWLKKSVRPIVLWKMENCDRIIYHGFMFLIQKTCLR